VQHLCGQWKPHTRKRWVHAGFMLGIGIPGRGMAVHDGRLTSMGPVGMRGASDLSEQGGKGEPEHESTDDLICCKDLHPPFALIIKLVPGYSSAAGGSGGQAVHVALNHAQALPQECGAGEGVPGGWGPSRVLTLMRTSITSASKHSSFAVKPAHWHAKDRIWVCSIAQARQGIGG
jgi:hypothetical protein